MVPDFKISLLKLSSIPIGISVQWYVWYRSIISYLIYFLLKDCSLLIINIFSEISLDLENSDLSFFFDISFLFLF